MKRITLLTGIIALVLVLLTESRVFAGVVIAETMVSSDPIGDSQVQTRIVYTQGDKRKVEGRGIDVITDLDRDILYIVVLTPVGGPTSQGELGAGKGKMAAGAGGRYPSELCGRI
jgi:hypothetical protein